MFDGTKIFTSGAEKKAHQLVRNFVNGTPAKMYWTQLKKLSYTGFAQSLNAEQFDVLLVMCREFRTKR